MCPWAGKQETQTSRVSVTLCKKFVRVYLRFIFNYIYRVTFLFLSYQRIIKKIRTLRFRLCTFFFFYSRNGINSLRTLFNREIQLFYFQQCILVSFLQQEEICTHKFTSQFAQISSKYEIFFSFRFLLGFARETRCRVVLIIRTIRVNSRVWMVYLPRILRETHTNMYMDGSQDESDATGFRDGLCFWRLNLSWALSWQGENI